MFTQNKNENGPKQKYTVTASVKTLAGYCQWKVYFLTRENFAAPVKYHQQWVHFLMLEK